MKITDKQAKETVEELSECPCCHYTNVCDDFVYVCPCCGRETCPDCAGRCECEINEAETDDQ